MNLSPERYVFLDTEFTSWTRPKLLSIALVDEDDNEAWIYGEVDLAAAASPLRRSIGIFARNHVLPQFGRVAGALGPIDVIARRAGKWLNARSARTLCVAYDYAADYELLEHMLGLSTEAVTTKLRATHVGYLLDDSTSNLAAASSYETSARRGLGRHHALADALALRARFRAVHG
jgi:hypothetical protein